MPRLMDRFTDRTKPADDSRSAGVRVPRKSISRNCFARWRSARAVAKTVRSYVWDSRTT
jgi:hypothetical protein